MWTVEDLALIGKAFPPHVVNILGRLEQRMLQSGETREEIIAEIRASYERSLLDDEHIPPPPRDEVQEQIDFIRWVVGDAMPAPAPVIQEPERKRDDLLDFDAEPLADLTGDMLLDAFEHDESETIAVVQTLSALRLKHLSEQLNVERARLDREHQATGVANPRSASIDRLLGLLTRRGEV
jgi:hypothetical protein